jgi:hypothetical protein
MTQVSKGRSNPVASFAVAAIVMAGAGTTTLQAKDWYSMAGPESTDSPDSSGNRQVNIRRV